MEEVLVLAKVINITIRFVPHPNPQQAIDFFARSTLEQYEKEMAEKGGETQYEVSQAAQ
jgi:hypothetical protein